MVFDEGYQGETLRHPETEDSIEEPETAESIESQAKEMLGEIDSSHQRFVRESDEMLSEALSANELPDAEAKAVEESLGTREALAQVNREEERLARDSAERIVEASAKEPGGENRREFLTSLARGLSLFALGGMRLEALGGKAEAKEQEEAFSPLYRETMRNFAIAAMNNKNERIGVLSQGKESEGYTDFGEGTETSWSLPLEGIDRLLEKNPTRLNFIHSHPLEDPVFFPADIEKIRQGEALAPMWPASLADVLSLAQLREDYRNRSIEIIGSAVDTTGVWEYASDVDNPTLKRILENVKASRAVFENLLAHNKSVADWFAKNERKVARTDPGALFTMLRQIPEINDQAKRELGNMEKLLEEGLPYGLRSADALIKRLPLSQGPERHQMIQSLIEQYSYAGIKLKYIPFDVIEGVKKVKIEKPLDTGE